MDGYIGFSSYYNEGGVWKRDAGPMVIAGVGWQGYQDSFVLRKDALIYALEQLELGEVEEIRFFMAKWFGYCTLVYVKSDTGEYMIPYGCVKRIPLEDGEVYTVEEIADVAWKSWYGRTYYCGRCEKTGLSWLDIHKGYVVAGFSAFVAFTGIYTALFVKKRKKEKILSE